MKTLAKISFLLVFFIMTANAQDVKSELDIIAIHELELLPGVDAKAFESFVLEKIIPVYSKMKGQKAMLFKGDRGIRAGKYAFILTFDSVEDRDRIYPPSGELVGDFGEEAMWEKFMTMTKGLGETHTDYAEITD
jgi:hypothetical protein